MNEHEPGHMNRRFRKEQERKTMEHTNILRAVVNGPLGAVGQALCRCLLQKGVETLAVCRPGDNRIQELPDGVKVIECDMRNISALPELIPGGADAFFHLAWMGTIGPDRDHPAIQAENIRCAVSAAEVSGELGCRVFIGAGSQAEYGRIEGLVRAEAPCFPLSGYGIAKLCAGQLTRIACRRRGIRHIWTRILSAYGPGDGPMSVIPTILRKLTEGEKPALTKGEQLWDFCYAGDIAEALYALAKTGKDGEIYPIGSGEVRPLRTYFELTRDTVDPSLPLGIGELPYAENQVMRMQADLTNLIRDTGYIPQTSFEEGIRETVRAYRERNGR